MPETETAPAPLVKTVRTYVPTHLAVGQTVRLWPGKRPAGVVQRLTITAEVHDETFGMHRYNDQLLRPLKGPLAESAPPVHTALGNGTHLIQFFGPCEYSSIGSVVMTNAQLRAHHRFIGEIIARLDGHHAGG